jgi:hypothetical protein
MRPTHVAHSPMAVDPYGAEKARGWHIRQGSRRTFHRNESTVTS